jgi:UPF0755 protein
MPYKWFAMTPPTKDQLSHAVAALINRCPKIRRWLIAITVLALGALTPALYFLHFIGSAQGKGAVVVILDFSTGQTMKGIAQELAHAHVISSGTLFSAYARLKGADARVQAGTYRFTDAMSPQEILDKLVTGDVFEQVFVVPEGYSLYQIAELLERQQFFNGKKFRDQCFNRSLLAELQIPGRSVEGFLFPSTYRITKDMDEAGLIRVMVANFRRIYDQKFSQHTKTRGLSQIQVLTLASIIEKEAILPEERPLIASVFFNRLESGMPLQSDPTAVYGIRAFAGKVVKQDIMRDTPYNTYRIPGLPPGPIGNPGEAAIHAVLYPAKTRFHYFVAKKDGSHHFSVTLEEHNRAVTHYLKSPNHTQ